jgi:hypothetical protein
MAFPLSAASIHCPSGTNIRPLRPWMLMEILPAIGFIFR